MHVPWESTVHYPHHEMRGISGRIGEACYRRPGQASTTGPVCPRSPDPPTSARALSAGIASRERKAARPITPVPDRTPQLPAP